MPELTQDSQGAVRRAAELLKVAQLLAREVEGYDSTPVLFYDKADCDAGCLADDIDNALFEMHRSFPGLEDWLETREIRLEE
jgi:hypothetical protein